MSTRNRSIIVFTICLAGLTQLAEVAPKEPLRSWGQISFAIGDTTIPYVESSEGMVLIAECRTTSVQTRRLHFGDGKHAVTYAASNRGLQTPTGKVNAAALHLKDGERVTTQQEELKPWGRESGEVYILVPNLKLAVQTD